MRVVTDSRPGEDTLGDLLDDTVKLLVWACKRQLVNRDDEELATGPAWLAERLHDAPTRTLSRDILTVAVREAHRVVEADPELDGHYAACLELIAGFDSDTRRLLDAHDRLVPA